MALFIQRVTEAQAPIMISSVKGKLANGHPVVFQDGTKGTVKRSVSKDEFLDWAGKLFPEEIRSVKTYYAERRRTFWEVEVD